ncbi:hypothetical protein FH972_014657 [Carpinus fangiana]|uniref:Protein E6 n=1 Tax=Carpinus fangiana TaxID=176857 RepID=A0A5N6RDV8_9ROSI|nr:hypothetical protein FH972_014657 [Carpinus fangiana]
MATFAKHLTVFLFSVLFTSLQIQARESKYGLYGGGSNEFPPTKETPTTTKFEDEFLTGELNGERFETGYPKTNLYNSNENSNNYNYNNNGYNSNNNNNNGYTPNYNTNGYSNNYNTNGYYSNNYNTNGYQTERQGMSDTRFLENGKYYFHVNNENNNVNGYETRKETTKNEGYYVNNMYPNEFNSMEEYEKQEENQEEFEP